MAFDPNFPFPLYLVISEKDCTHFPWLKVAEEAILGGVDLIQLREKACPYSDFLARAQDLKQLCDQHQIPLVINDQVQVAEAIDAWGVHVGQSDMPPIAVRERIGPNKKIGWSLESLDQLTSPQLQFVDHVGLSPIFRTPTKKDTITEWGLAGIERVRKLTSVPLIAIGQMNLKNAEAAFVAGANSIAVVSAICGSSNPRESAQLLKIKLTS